MSDESVHESQPCTQFPSLHARCFHAARAREVSLPYADARIPSRPMLLHHYFSTSEELVDGCVLAFGLKNNPG